MPVFVMMGRPVGGFIPAAEAGGAVLSKRLNSKIMNNLLRLHFWRPLNRIFELPGKSLWWDIVLDENRIDPDEKVYFLFLEGFRLAYSKEYLAHLRQKFTHSKFIHIFSNPVCSIVSSGLLREWESVRHLYDASITLNRSDAAKLGITFCDYWPCLLPQKDFQPERASDVFFIGRAKDRLPQILSVYERLSEAGLKCEFYIVDVPESEQRYSDIIHYNKRITYDENLQMVRNTKCVLEVLPFGQNYSSLRVCEALWYHKKLLTTNIEAPDEWFYNPEIVQCFTDPQEINIDFITSTLSPEDENRIFGDMDIGNFRKFAEFVVKIAG